MSSLRSSLIRLAHANPELRPHLLPLLKVAKSTSPLETWEEERPLFRMAISPALFLRIRRALRGASPAALDIFNLYNWLQEASMGAPLPDGGFQAGIKNGLVALTRALPRFMSGPLAQEVAGVLKGIYMRSSPPLKVIDKGHGSKRNFADVSVALTEGFTAVLNAVDLPTETYNIPGSVRFLGMRHTKPEEGNPPMPEEVAQTFTPEEESLPTKTYQNTKDIDELYQNVEQAEELQLDLLNRGNGLDSKIGATVVYPGQELDLMGEPGPVIMIGPRKRKERVLEKTRSENEDVDAALDLVRSTIAVNDLQELPQVINHLRDMGVVFARKPKNRFNKPTDVGYRDLLFNVRYPNGHVGEIQVNLKSMLVAKDMGHKFYERSRTIEARKKLEGDRTLTLEEQQTVDIANEAQKRLYDEAWQQAVGVSGAALKLAMVKTAEPIKYFEYKESPAYVIRGKFPIRLNNRGGVVVVYDQEKFYREACRISKMEYDSMVQDLTGER